MRAKLIIAALLGLVSSPIGIAGQPEPRYTTLVVEYVGVQNRYVPPVVISASSEEGEWYKQHLFPEPWGGLAATYVVPISALNEITESPLLKHQLERAKPVDDEPKTLMNVRFTAGVGHDHVEIIVTDQTSAKILKDMAGVVAKYSDLKSELQEIADQVNPLTFQKVTMGEIQGKLATEAGFRTRGWPHAHFGLTVFKAPNGNALTMYYGDFANPDEAKRFFDWKAHKASQVLWRDTQTDADGKPIGYRYRAEFVPQRKRRYVEVMWVVGVTVHWIDSTDLREAVELEGQYRYSSVECPSNAGC
jgi:hypothetical protein